ncbi:MBL fold metallo-hydrolase [Pseudoflavonifractor phocaeensis]|nr:MBL fold metallo-hydrolase [Pseudoflavonifractor phocaeensis]
MAEGYPIHEHCDLKEKLAELDLTVDDIDMLIISHLYFDHAGNVRMFRGTKAGKAIIVQEEEAKNAFFYGNKDDPALNLYVNGYVRHEYSGLDGIAYKLVQGDVKLADDLELLLLPGHTPGTMGLLVRTEQTGTVIFPADAIYNSINYGPPTVLPGMCARPVEYRASVDKCRKILEAEKGTLFFSHDVNSYKNYKLSPEWYD